MADGCKFPAHELREEHKCRSCEKFLHVLCAERSDPQDDRVIYCGTCDLDNNQSETEYLLALEAIRKRRKLNKKIWKIAQQPRRGIIPTPLESSDESETETEPEDDNEDNPKTVVSESDTCIAKKTVATTAAIVPQVITEKRTMSNCLISTITQSVDGKTRFIPKDYFLKFDQRVNMEYKTKDNKKWVNMRNEIEKEINQDIILRMVRRAQQVGLYFVDESTGEKKLVTSIKEIGTAYSNDDSEECATKVYACLNQDFPIRSGYERSIESVIMNRLNIKYTDPDTTAKGSIARMVVKRKCNIAKVINKRCTHQRKILIKRTKEEVKALPVKDAEQAFSVGKNGWFTNEGKRYQPTGTIKSKRTNFYINRIAKLESELKHKNDIINLNNGISNDLKKKVVEQKDHIANIENDTLKTVVNEMINAKSAKANSNVKNTKSKPVTKQKKKVIQNKSCSKAKAVVNDRKTPSKTATKKIITRKSNSKIQRNETCDNTKRKKVTSKCPYDHTHYSYAYHEEWNCKYFAQNGALYDVRCNECQKLITDEEKEGSVMPTMCRPVFVCGGRNHYECKNTLCNVCYNKKILEDKPRSMRTRTSKK